MDASVMCQLGLKPIPDNVLINRKSKPSEGPVLIRTVFDVSFACRTNEG